MATEMSFKVRVTGNCGEQNLDISKAIFAYVRAVAPAYCSVEVKDPIKISYDLSVTVKLMEPRSG